VEERKKITPVGLINLFVVYFVWGSTYLAIRIGIRSGSGFQPFWFGGLRVLVAGAILLLLAVIRGKDIRPNKMDLKVLIASGFLLWIGGNGLVVLAEQRIDSGIAALIVASTPIWVALSPTPPLECLSTARGTAGERSRISPVLTIARVRSVVSWGVIPFSRTAIAQDEA